jgi:hypothetical protein
LLDVNRLLTIDKQLLTLAEELTTEHE